MGKSKGRAFLTSTSGTWTPTLADTCLEKTSNLGANDSAAGPPSTPNSLNLSREKKQAVDNQNQGIHDPHINSE